MSKIITLLQHDHAHFLKMLDGLETQAKLVAQGREPDRSYIRSVIDGFTGVPRRVHNQREDVLLKMIERHAPHLGANILGIILYHRTLDVRLDDLAKCFDSFEKNVEGSRAAFVTAAIRFAEFEKDHFILEDEHLFPAARRVLSPEELKQEFPWESLPDKSDACPSSEVSPAV